MARIKHFRIVPPGGWRYVQPETGVRFSSDTFDGVVTKVTEHRIYKGIPADGVALDVERQLCSGLSLEQCEPEPGENYTPVRDLSAELTTGLALSLGRAVTAFVAGGGQFVAKAEAERRATICRGCPFNRPSRECPCTAVYAVVEAMIPAARREAGISVCMACGCSLQAKVNLPPEVVAASLAPEVVTPPWCWQRPPAP